MKKLIIANRGEIAIRIGRAAAELNIATVAVHSVDDAASLHVARCDEAVALPGNGAAAYLDIEQVIAAAKANGCDALHPGYGFLSENTALARRCAEENIVFVGPRPEMLELLGDKTQARALAERLNVPLLRGTRGATSLEQAQAFMHALGPGAAVMVKALAGGGGRGMRVVTDPKQLDEALARSSSEAQAAFGNGAVYLEQFLEHARHLEVQIVGDGNRVVHLWERECTLQRRHQKLVEIAPSPTLSASLRDAIVGAALRLAEALRYVSLGTFEFLVDANGERFYFIEANPRLQVEHTVTEEVTGIDLVKTQLAIASGRSLEDLQLTQSQIPAPRGFAIELRINAETMLADGNVLPAGGTLQAFDPPSGPGIRVDTYGYAGYALNGRFDSLIGKLIAHSSSPLFEDVVAKALRALREFRVTGVSTNLTLLKRLLSHPDVRANRVYTRFIEDHVAELVTEAANAPRDLYFGADAQESATREIQQIEGPPGTVPLPSPIIARVVSIDVGNGTFVKQGEQVAVLEAMKMEYVITTETSGVVRLIGAIEGENVAPGQALMFIEPATSDAQQRVEIIEEDLDRIRPDLAEVLERTASLMDAARPDAVARRRKTKQRTARENVEDLCDPGSFSEYGGFAVASQRHRRTEEELRKISPADGLVAGVATVNRDRFGDEQARCVVIAYDYTVFAGTQGHANHRKKDRLFQLAEKWKLPVIMFAEGGGGRPGDDWTRPAALDVPSFASFARLSGLVPSIGIVDGRCFAGNAALLGCCDVIIATRRSNIGMGGPAMIEGGGLGVYKPEEVGPIDVQGPNGVVDVVVADEAEGVAVAKRYLSYFQGALDAWQCADQRKLRAAIPENRVRVYDIRALIEMLVDEGSMLELRKQFGIGMITALVRIEGHPMGLIANNPLHLGGAIDAEAADKASRFMQLCDAFDLPIVSLVDTPGFMVGPEVEKTAQVRHVCRMFVTAASMTVPMFGLVLRKGYGLGSQAMVAGSMHEPFFTAAWPTGEFGPMGLEGAVRLGFRKEMEAIADPQERQAYFERMVAKLYQEGKGLNMAAYLEIDTVIDPVDSRRWIMRGFRSMPPRIARERKKRPFVDTW